MNELFRIKNFLSYQWKSQTKYYLHSPFVYQFYLNILEGKDDKELNAIHALRKKIRSDHSLVEVEDLGTGNSSPRKISDLEKGVSVPEKYGRVLYYLVKHFRPKTILEIGTCMGISSSYLAMAKPDAHIVTLEGSQNLVEIARRNHSTLGLKNIEIVTGDFDKTLSSTIQRFPSLDLVLFDGNHREDATLTYFQQCLTKATENSIFIFDDIYWSGEMSEAWKQIKDHPQITLTLDIFQFGICFFKKEKLAKENFVLRY